jgi:protein-tyrosine phosphatase
MHSTHANDIERPSRWRELLRFFADFNPSVRCAVWSIKDPRPALSEFIQAMINLAKSDVKVFLKWILPERILIRIRVYHSLGPSLGRVFARMQLRRFLRLQPIRFGRTQEPIRCVAFVCHGSIFRSPTAAALMRQALPAVTRDSIRIESAGLWPGLAKMEPRPVLPEAKNAARELGVSLEEHRSQPVTVDLVNSADAIFVMDFRNEAMLVEKYPHVRRKVYLLGACTEPIPFERFEIPDPFHKEVQEIRDCFALIDERIKVLSQTLSE